MTQSPISHRSESPLITQALMFAAVAHAAVGQVRKYTFEPYVHHPIAVAQILRDHGVTDEAMICAALLHDVVEDTKISPVMISRYFGDDVWRLVAELTDVSVPSDGNRAERKRIDRYHTARASARAKSVKLADLIDNSRSILEHDPGFARTYMAEKRLLLDVLHDASIPSLWVEANRIVEDYERRISGT